MAKWLNPIKWIAPWYGCVQNVPTYPQPQRLLFADEIWNSKLLHKVLWITLTTWHKARFGNFYLFNVMGGGGVVCYELYHFSIDNFETQWMYHFANIVTVINDLSNSHTLFGCTVPNHESAVHLDVSNSVRFVLFHQKRALITRCQTGDAAATNRALN